MKASDIAAWVGVGLAVIAILVALAVAIWQRSRARLVYIVRNHGQLLAQPPRDFQDRVAITFDNVAIDSPTLVALDLINSGNVAIPASKFENELVISYPAVRVVAIVVSGNPASLHPVSGAVGREVLIQPLLLNPRDRITVTALVEGPLQGPIAVSGRIADVRAIEQREPGQETVWSTTLRVASSTTVAAGASLLAVIVAAITQLFLK
ncbi:MAG: hypothetical protein LC808_20550 [Actinobacteria bacterium]|nr:hypothetical protein [Actinomycetota bacterium]